LGKTFKDMAVKVGKYLVISVEGNIYTALRSSSLELAADMIDITTADSTGGWKEYLTGELGGTISVEGLYDHSATDNVSTAFADMVAGTSLTWKYGTTTTGEKYLTGEAIISNVTYGGDKNDAATYSITLQITGAVTEGTNT